LLSTHLVMRRRTVGAILMAAAALMAAYAAYAVLISLASTNIAQLGGTGLVSVNCPGDPCQVSEVTWTISNTAPYRVTNVNVKWKPASSAATASYTVYVTLYDSSNGIVGSGSQSQSGSADAVTTSVPVSPVSPYTSIDPKDVYKVEIVIVQTAF
jgi:hypothetical protein